MLDVILRAKASAVVVRPAGFSFGGGLFRWVTSLNLLVFISRGDVTIADGVVRYELRTTQSLVVDGALSLLLAFRTGRPGFGLLAFAALYGGNLLLAWPRFHLALRRACDRAAARIDNGATSR